MLSAVVTVTVSPGVKGCAGRKLPPKPSESERSLPVCDPLRLPRTLIVPRSPIGSPLNVIPVRGAAYLAPAIG